jgi:hypothetical protein
VPGGQTVENDAEVALEPLVTVVAKVPGLLDQSGVLAQGGVAFGERVARGVGVG